MREIRGEKWENKNGTEISEYRPIHNKIDGRLAGRYAVSRTR